MSQQDRSLDFAQARTRAREFVVATLSGVAFLSVAEAARFLGIAEITLRHKICSKTFPLPTKRFGGRRLIPVAALIDFVAQSLLDDVCANPLDMDEAFEGALKDALDVEPSPSACTAKKLGARRKAPPMPKLPAMAPA